ncbi:BnaCnng46330D [Brassica napus]|nr:unnamed protein product [Brassica napus]CDY65268.1 BnaCnng46330D [Brassica napus]
MDASGQFRQYNMQAKMVMWYLPWAALHPRRDVMVTVTVDRLEFATRIRQKSSPENVLFLTERIRMI